MTPTPEAQAVERLLKKRRLGSFYLADVRLLEAALKERDERLAREREARKAVESVNADEVMRKRTNLEAVIESQKAEIAERDERIERLDARYLQARADHLEAQTEVERLREERDEAGRAGARRLARANKRIAELIGRNQFLSTEQVRADVLEAEVERLGVALRKIERSGDRERNTDGSIVTAQQIARAALAKDESDEPRIGSKLVPSNPTREQYEAALGWIARRHAGWAWTTDDSWHQAVIDRYESLTDDDGGEDG